MLIILENMKNLIGSDNLDLSAIYYDKFSTVNKTFS